MPSRLTLGGVLVSLALTACQSGTSSDNSAMILAGASGALLDSVLTPYVDEIRRRTDNTAAIAIGVTVGQQIVYARVVGFADVASRTPADLETRFHIASVTKPFTAAAVLRLAQDGALTLDDPVTAHLPGFPLAGPHGEPVTLRQMLVHTSGIPRDLIREAWLHPASGPDALALNLDAAASATLVATPGTAFNYSNSAYDLLGLVVERVSGRPYAEYLTTAILRPAGVVRGTFDRPPASPDAGWAAPHSYGISTRTWTPFPWSGVSAPSTGLHASILDMAAWGMVTVGRGTTARVTVLDAEAFAAMVASQGETPWGDRMGLGWFLQAHRGHPNLMHLGEDTGFEAAMYVYPEDSLSITVLANRDFARAGRIALAAAEVLFDGTPAPVTVSAKYRFAEALRTEGLERATATWFEMADDSTAGVTSDVDDLLTTGAVLENGGEWRAARDVLTFYLSLGDPSPYAWRLLGNAHLGLGDTTAAEESYEAALQIDPGYAKAQDALRSLRVGSVTGTPGTP